MEFSTEIAQLNPSPWAAFTPPNVYKRGGTHPGGPAQRHLPPSRLAPDRPKTSRKESERVARNERKPMVFKFSVLGQLLTLQVRSNTRSAKPILYTGDGDIADAIKPTETGESLSK